MVSDVGLTSSDVVRRALLGNRELAAARIEIDRARGRLRQAELYPNPTLEVEHSRGLGAQREVAVGLALTLPIFGRRSTSVARARAALALAQVEVLERERLLVTATLSALVEVLASARALELSRQLEQVNANLRNLVSARVHEQDVPALDLRMLDVEIARLRARQLVAGAHSIAQGYALRALLGMKENEPLNLRDQLVVPDLLDGMGSVGDAVARAMEHRPDLQTAHAEEDLAAGELARVRAEARPEIGLFGRYSSKTATSRVTGDAERLIGGGISISLPVLNRNQGAIAEAEAAVRQAALHRDAVEDTVRSEAASAFVRLESVRSALALYESNINPAGEANLETLRRAYAMGAIPLGEVLNEQRRMIDANNDFVSIATEAYRAAADLQFAIGGGSLMDGPQ